MIRLGVAIALAVSVTPLIAAAEPRPIHEGVTGPFQPAERGVQVQVNPPPPPPTTVPSGPPSITPGDCESVRRVFDYFDPSGQSSAFFIDGGIAFRETRCGSDTLNEATGDTGVVQLNPVHNRAGYFGSKYFGAGGWLYQLHGLRTRTNTLSPQWANAAITLRQVCGNGPWNTGGRYSCANRRLIWPRR
jgi:hypothetical protein